MKFAKTALCFVGIRNTVAPPTGEETVSLAGNWRWSNYKQIYKENENFFDLQWEKQRVFGGTESASD